MFLLLAGCTLNNEKGSEPIYLEAEKLPDFFDMDDDTVVGQFEDVSYVLTSNGHLNLIDSLEYSLDFNIDGWIERIFFFRYGSDFLVFFGYGDAEGGTSEVQCFNENYMLKWSAPIHGFNLSKPAILDDHCYLATFTLAGKLDLTTGKYDWMYDDLFETLRFDAFSKIELSEGEVKFIESTFHDEQKPGYIIIDNETGEILKLKGKS